MLMRKLVLAGLLMSLTATFIVAQSGSAARIPETPAGRQLTGYLAAFNSGDAKVLREYLKKNDTREVFDNSSDDKLAFIIREFGKLEVHRLVETTDQQIKAVLKSEKNKWAWVWVEVETAAPHRITGFRFDLTAPDAEK